jgi:DNA-binding LytR/AlgR family response regulator
MKHMQSTTNIGLVLLSSDFRVIGVNDYIQRIFGPVLGEMGKSLFQYHARRSRERVRGLLREMCNAPLDVPRTVIIDVLGKAMMYNLSRLAISAPIAQDCWAVTVIDVSEQTGAKKNPESGMVEMKKIPVFEGGAYHFIPTDSVMCIKSDGDYCTVYTAAKSHYLHLNLKTLLERYPRTTFFRVHKSFVVNLSYVNAITRSKDDGRSTIVFDNESIPPISVSRRKLAEFKEAVALL